MVAPCQLSIERGCGLDVHQATAVTCLLIIRKDRKVQKQMRTLGTTTRELMGLRQWLLSEGCTHVATESTGVGVYWKPVCVIVEGARVPAVYLSSAFLAFLAVVAIRRINKLIAFTPRV